VQLLFEPAESGIEAQVTQSVFRMLIVRKLFFRLRSGVSMLPHFSGLQPWSGSFLFCARGAGSAMRVPIRVVVMYSCNPVLGRSSKRCFGICFALALSSC